VRALLALIAALALPSTAVAATLTVSAPMTVTVPGITLSGDDQPKTFTMAHTVVYTGSGNTLGWNIQVASTALTSGSRTLPAMQVTGVTNANCTMSGCVNPTNSVTWPVTLNATGVKIFNAAANTGKGSVILTATYQLIYPANAIPGTYTATMTVTAAAGP
jgi:hypothetical protein